MRRKQAEQRQRRARQDRPQRHTPDTYYTWLQSQQQDGSVLFKRRERAAAAAISTATLDRLEDALEQAGRIQITVATDRSGSTVTLLDGVINIVAPAKTAAPNDTIDLPKIVPEEVLSGPLDTMPDLPVATPGNRK